MAWKKSIVAESVSESSEIDSTSFTPSGESMGGSFPGTTDSEIPATESDDILDDVPVLPPEDRLPTIPQLCVAIGILAAVLGYPSLVHFFHTTASTPAVAVEETAPAPPKEAAPPRVDPFSEVSLEARAAYVWDVSAQRVLYAQNAHAQLPLASLTKLMTAVVAHETYGAEAQVPITLSAIGQEGENGFKDGDTWRAKDLLAYTLMTSSNDGAYALAAAAGAALASDGADTEEAFIRKMNAKAKEIGLTQTYFTNPTGLDTSLTQSGSYGSARDVAFLMEYIVRSAPELLEKTADAVSKFTDTAGMVYTATNTNQTIGQAPNPLGSKTGYTVLAGGNLVIAFDAGLNHPVIISVLGSSREGRFADIQTLTQKTLEVFAQKP